MIKPKKVKFTISNPFANLKVGTIIDALLIAEDGSYGLIYHPKVRGEIGSFEIAIEGNDGFWDSIPECTYVNVIDDKFEKTFLGKSFKFKRTEEPSEP